MTDPLLREVQRLPASGARTAEPIRIPGTDLELLAIPQLAYDVPGQPANMNGGDSDTEVLLLRRDPEAGRYEPWGTLPAPGGEDAEFFVIDGRAFLAVASIRSGKGPYAYTTDSVVFVWDGERFTPFQTFPGFAAKQWRHFTVGDRHFLAFAQGVAVPGHEDENRRSEIHVWNGERFEYLQDVPSQWGYNWHSFTVDGTDFLAYADHVLPSVLLRWDGERFVHHQDLAPRSGRAFATFEDAGGSYLVVACIEDTSRVLRWNGKEFEEHQELAGSGARELTVVETPGGRYVIRVNFIQGPRTDPTTALKSQVYRWTGERLEVVEEYSTNGGTDAVVIPDGPRGPLVIQTNSLSPEVRFGTECVVYRFTG